MDTVGMSEGKRFSPKCKAWTMEEAEEILTAKEEFTRVEPVGPLAFERRLTPYRCPICTHVVHEPVV
jgi:hypothetical protein